METVYVLIVYPDNSFAVCPYQNFKADNYQEGSKFFITKQNTTINELSKFIANMYISEKFTDILLWKHF